MMLPSAAMLSSRGPVFGVDGCKRPCVPPARHPSVCHDDVSNPCAVRRRQRPHPGFESEQVRALGRGWSAAAAPSPGLAPARIAPNSPAESTNASRLRASWSKRLITRLRICKGNESGSAATRLASHYCGRREYVSETARDDTRNQSRRNLGGGPSARASLVSRLARGGRTRMR